MFLGIGLLILLNNPLTEAQTSASVNCASDEQLVSISIDDNIINFDDPTTINAEITINNLSDTLCTTEIVVEVTESSGLKLVGTDQQWNDREGLVRNTLDSGFIELKPKEKKHLNLEVSSVNRPTTDHYRISATVVTDRNTLGEVELRTQDWRNIWIWAEPEKSSTKSRSLHCNRPISVKQQTLEFKSGVILTPLTLKLDCNFNYTILDTRIQNAEILPLLRLKPRNSVAGSNEVEAQTKPFPVSPTHEISEQYLVIFNGLPRDLPGLRIIAQTPRQSDVEEAIEIVRYSPRISERITNEVGDAYETVNETKTLGLFVYINSVISSVALWLMFYPIGRVERNYKWKPAGKAGTIWTLSSAALVIGTISLITLSLVSIIGAIIAGKSATSLMPGMFTAFLATSIGFSFFVSMVRQRSRSKKNKNKKSTALPWWLQNPFLTESKARPDSGRIRRKRKKRDRSIFARIFATDRQLGRAVTPSAGYVGWRWVYLLTLAGAASIFSISFLTP